MQKGTDRNDRSLNLAHTPYAFDVSVFRQAAQALEQGLTGKIGIFDNQVGKDKE